MALLSISNLEPPKFTDYVEIGTAKLELVDYSVDGDIGDAKPTITINSIQKETKPMEANKYYDLLIHGYMREIEQMITLIPDEIKTLCIAFYYKFLMYNKHCNVRFKKEFDAPKLLIQTALTNESKETDEVRPLYFGCRLVSRLPINLANEHERISKVNIQIVDGFVMENPSSSEEFECVVINTYYASVTDELDLVLGEKYTIMQTSPSGWWYAVDKNGLDGWVPSNYLQRTDESGFGQIGIGITTNPESFMKMPLDQHPFKGKNVKHAICRLSNKTLIVTDGKAKSHELTSDKFNQGVLISLWIENEQIKIYGGVGSQHLLCERNLLKGDDGNILNYYFAMAFTAKSKQIVKCEFSGDFI